MGALYVFLRKSLAVLYIVFFVVAVFSVVNVFVVAEEPPSSGDWIVNGTESYSDREIVLNGHLTVGPDGNLTFRKVTLKMNSTYKGQYSIAVHGRFYVLDESVITSVDPENEYQFTVHDGATFRMTNSELHECGVDGGDALWILSNDVIIENNLISNNNIGIRCQLSSPVIRNNNISSSSAMGIFLWQYSNATIEGNYITGNSGSGIDCNDHCNPLIVDNVIASNLGHGVTCGNYSSPTIVNNTIASNLDKGIECRDYSSPAIVNNTIMSNGNGVFSSNGCKPTIVNNTIKLNLHTGVGCSGSSNATIQGNTITTNGGGIGCWDSSPTIYNNTIALNRGGVYCQGYSNSTIQRNSITLNNGGGITLDQANAFIQDNIITLNNVYGISGVGAPNLVIQGNNITSNSGWGISFKHDIQVTIQGNIIMNNSGGVGFYDVPNLLIQGNIITSNKGDGVKQHLVSPYTGFPVGVVWNDIYSNENYGVLNEDSTVTVDAAHNYWGSGSGPVQSPPDAIDPEEVSENVLYTSWLAEPIFSAEITSPLSGEMVSSTVKVSTEVDAKHGVQRVEFYIDDKLKYTDYDASYEWNWDTTQCAETEHKITAKAHDNCGLKISTSITVLVDNTPPTISFTEPLSGSTCYRTLTISVNATDNREVRDVRVKVDNSAWLGMTYNSTETVWEYALNTTTLSDGQHTVMSLALDKAGNPATTSITIITDNNPPTLTIQSPTSGMTVGLTLIVSVQATDISNISKVEFYLLNVLVNTAYTAPYQWAWDTTRYPNGEYTITVKAYDSLGNVKSQNTVVTVYNVEVPWWQANFWTIVQVFIALGGLMFAIVTYWSRTRQKRKKKKTKKKETEKAPDTDD